MPFLHQLGADPPRAWPGRETSPRSGRTSNSTIYPFCFQRRRAARSDDSQCNKYSPHGWCPVERNGSNTFRNSSRSKCSAFPLASSSSFSWKWSYLHRGSRWPRSQARPLQPWFQFTDLPPSCWHTWPSQSPRIYVGTLPIWGFLRRWVGGHFLPYSWKAMYSQLVSLLYQRP